MNSTAAWDWWTGEVNWDTPAGRVLRRFAAALPRDRTIQLCLYGSAPLQLTLDPHWLSADVDLFADDDTDLAKWVAAAGLGKGKGELYLEPGFELSFRTSAGWRKRAKLEQMGRITFLIPHPIDILIGKLDRLDEKDLLAFRRVIQLTGHPTAEELKRELQNAVDLFRPAFEEEQPNRYPENTRRVWRELWQAEINLTRDIVQPALARRQQGYGEPPPPYKRALES